MAVARDIKGKRERIVSVISNGTTMAGQLYEAMSNAGYLDSNMVVILNDSRHSLLPKTEEGPKTSVSALSSTLSRFQSSKSFRKFREVAKVCLSFSVFLSNNQSCGESTFPYIKVGMYDFKTLKHAIFFYKVKFVLNLFFDN